MKLKNKNPPDQHKAALHHIYTSKELTPGLIKEGRSTRTVLHAKMPKTLRGRFNLTSRMSSRTVRTSMSGWIEARIII